MASQCCFVVSVLLCLLALAASQEVKSPEGTAIDSSESPESESDGKALIGACLLPKQSGPCKAFFKKYYYDQAEARCRSFVYGGCNGNDNQFDSWELCREACEGLLLTP